MGVFRSLLVGRPDPVLSAALNPPATTFAVDTDDVPPEVFGLSSYGGSGSVPGKVARREAIQVGAVKRCRDLIAGSLGQLPLVTVRSDLNVDAATWLSQPERNVPPSVTMTRTVEDMLFDGIAWWRITESGYDGFPLYVERLAHGRAIVDDVAGKVYVDGKETDQSTLIRFDSPNDPLLTAAARAIRQCLILDQAAQRYAEGAPPGDYFKPSDVDPFEDAADVQAKLLDPWATARRLRSTGYVPYGVDYVSNPFDPQQLELAAQRDHAVVEVARHAGVDSEEVGVSTTSRTYANSQDRRKSFLDFTLGGYRAAIEGRLSMGDVTKRGTTVRFDLSDFLRSDDLSRYQAIKAGLEVGAIAQDEVRPLERKPALPIATSPARLAPVPTQETA